MTERKQENYHCQNCAAESTVRPVESPQGDEYWVCSGCEEYIENGEGRAVKHGMYASV